MVSTIDCMLIRRHLDESIKYRSGFLFQHFEIAPLYNFAKFGNQLEHLYIVRNTTTDKLQLWYSDIDKQYINGCCHRWQSITEVVQYAFTECRTKQIIPFEFDDIEILLDYTIQLDYPYSYMAFLIRENAKTGMFISNGDNIDLIHWYESIDLIGFDYLLAKDKDQSFILDKMGNVVCALGQYHFKQLIDGGTYLAENDERQLIIKFNGTVVAPIVLGRFERLTDENHYLTHVNNGYAIYDFYGNVITGGYNIIKNSNDKYIVAEKSEEFYLIDLSGLVILKSKDFMTVSRAFWAK